MLCSSPFVWGGMQYITSEEAGHDITAELNHYHSWMPAYGHIYSCNHNTYITVNYTNYTQSRSVNTIMYTMAANYTNHIQSLKLILKYRVYYDSKYLSLKFAGHHKLTSYCKCTACTYDFIDLKYYHMIMSCLWSCSQSFSPRYYKRPLPVHPLPIEVETNSEK